MEAKIWNHSQWIDETNKEILYRLFNNMIKQSEFGIMSYIDHDFDPIGYTGIWLLEESHFAIHTFPEHDKSYIEISSCNLQKHNQFLLRLLIYERKEKSEKSR